MSSSVSYALDHAPKGTSRFARWEGDEEPTIGTFRSSEPKLVEEEETEDEGNGAGDALAFIAHFNPGDRLFTEMGGASDKICLAVARRGVAVFRIPTFELKQARVVMGMEPLDNVRVLCRLSRDEPAKFYPLRAVDQKILELRVFTRGYVMVQREVRIKTQLRLLGILRDLRLIEGLPEAETEEKKEFLNKNPIFTGAAAYEEELKKKVAELLKGIPLYRAVFEPIRGVGPLIGGALMAEMQDIRRFPTAAALKAYAGYHLTPEGKRPIRGQDHWNANLKQAVFKWVEATQKQPKGTEWRDKLEARVLYEKSQHPKKIKDEADKTRFNPGHLRNRAKRWLAQQFLEYVWREWAKFEGLAVVEGRLEAA